MITPDGYMPNNLGPLTEETITAEMEALWREIEIWLTIQMLLREPRWRNV